jgi:hypothetical protein
MIRNKLRIHFSCVVVDAKYCKYRTPARNTSEEKDHSQKHYGQRMQNTSDDYSCHKQYVANEDIGEIHIWFHTVEAILYS